MLLDRHAQIVADTWITLADDAPMPPSGAVVTLARLLAQPPTEGVAPCGVILPAGADVAPILPFLGRLALVVIPFPGFRDGRGFSTARALRERHGFTGEIRAAGHLLPDQYVALLRVGFSTVALPDDTDVGPWLAALRLNGELPGQDHKLPWLRRAALPFEAA